MDKRIKMQIHRLRESVEHLESYTALQVDHQAVIDELEFLNQAAYGLRVLVTRDKEKV